MRDKPVKQWTLTAVLAGLLCCAPAVQADPVVRETPQGKIQGALTGASKTIQAYKGIPYAVPPVGERRWQPAEPAPAWKGVRDGSSYSPVCHQLPYPEVSIFFNPAPVASEDCLYLNVWTGAQAGDNAPVMVWIHGGGLTRGSGSNPAYDGAALAEKGVVVVTLNYRLDIFGHFAHPELSAESPHGVSGNQSITDQIQALKWVQENIRAYGGDPNQVTIFGESAGSWSVNHLVASPLAKDLFHRAIGQSGAVLDVMPHLKRPSGQRPAAEKVGENIASAAKVKTIAELRKLTADEILSLSERGRFQSRGIVDGHVIPAQIYDMFAQGRQNAVPVMVGYNADEGTVLGAYSLVPKTEAAYNIQLKMLYGDLAEQYAALYPPTDLTRQTLAIFRDSFATWPMQTWAMMMANVKQDAYLYYFSHRPPGPDQELLGAFHAAEILYVFDNVPASEENDAQLAEEMSNYWVNFAKTGNPNGDGLPTWNPYRKDDRHYMEFNKEVKAGSVPGKDLFPGVWELWEQYYAKRRPE